mmetsp:Transcript_22844/g.58573  ORF Transcript_22844/g.58573 Transcript_22844/m.58573 type:complete len:204 (-) Transcript_22844:1856-2467(-)
MRLLPCSLCWGQGSWAGDGAAPAHAASRRAYIPVMASAKAALACGRLSLKVGVSSPFSTEKGSATRWIAPTCSKPCSLAPRPSSTICWKMTRCTLGLEHSASTSCGSPCSLAHGSSVSASGTTTATSCALSESPCTNACATSGQRWYTPSIFSGATYSPCASLNRFFLRSMIRSRPPSTHIPTSPVCSQPSSSSASRVCTSSL